MSAVEVGFGQGAATMALLARLVGATSGSLAEARAKLDELWIEACYYESGGSVEIMQRRKANGITKAKVAAARGNLNRAEVDAEHARAAYVAAVAVVKDRQEQLDVELRKVLGDAADRWHDRAAELRARAEATPDTETTVLRMTEVVGVNSGRIEPRFVLTRDRLLGLAASAERYADELAASSSPEAAEWNHGDRLEERAAGVIEPPIEDKQEMIASGH